MQGTVLGAADSLAKNYSIEHYWLLKIKFSKNNDMKEMQYNIKKQNCIWNLILTLFKSCLPWGLNK